MDDVQRKVLVGKYFVEEKSQDECEELRSLSRASKQKVVHYQKPVFSSEVPTIDP